jgi:two-component system, OmpR family, response regulator
MTAGEEPRTAVYPISAAAPLMPSRPSVRVLLVEDSEVLAGRIAELIRRLPDVELIGAVDNEEEAVGSVGASMPDVVILDLHLRAGSGFGVLRSLRRSARPRPKIIVLTGFDLPEYRREAESFGVEAFLNKSRDYHRLPSLLRSLAGQSPAQREP